MKDKIIIVVFIIVALLLGVFLFFTTPAIKYKQQAEYKHSAGREDLSSLKEQVRQSKDLVQSFSKSNIDLSADLQDAQLALMREKQKVENLASELKDMGLKNQMLNKELLHTKESLDSLKALTKPIRRKFEGLESTFDGIRSSLTILGFSPENEEELKKQFSNLNASLTAIEAQIPDLINQNRSYRRQAEILENILTEKDSQIQNLQNTLSNKEEKFKQLIDKSPDLQKKILTLQEERDFLEEQLKQSTIAKQDFIYFKKEKLSLDRELNKLKNKNALLTRKITQLKKRISRKGENRVISSLTKINEQLKAQLELTKDSFHKLNNEYAALKKEYDLIQGTISKKEAELAKRAERILSFQDRLSVAEAKIERFQGETSQHQEESASLRKQYVSRQLENEQLRTQLRQYKERLADLQAQIVKATKANAMLQDKFKEISGMLETQGGELSEKVIKKVDVELIPKAEAEAENE